MCEMIDESSESMMKTHYFQERKYGVEIIRILYCFVRICERKYPHFNGILQSYR